MIMSETPTQRRVTEFLKEPLEVANARLEEFEEGAQRILKGLVEKGRATRKDFTNRVQRLSKQEWNLRARADSLRADALARIEDLQAKAVNFLGIATREQVKDLSLELERLAKRLEKMRRARRAVKPPQV